MGKTKKKKMRKLLLFVGQISAYAKNTSDTSVLSAVVLYVTNFFTCAECGENFERETQDFRGFLADGKRAIKYLWQVIAQIILILIRRESILLLWQ